MPTSDFCPIQVDANGHVTLGVEDRALLDRIEAKLDRIEAKLDRLLAGEGDGMYGEVKKRMGQMLGDDSPPPGSYIILKEPCR